MACSGDVNASFQGFPRLACQMEGSQLEEWSWQLLCSSLFFQVNQTAAPWISQPVYNYRLAENAVFVPPSGNLLPCFCPQLLAIWPLNLGNVLFVSPWRAVPVAAKPQETDTEWALEDADTFSITALHPGQQGHQPLYPVSARPHPASTSPLTAHCSPYPNLVASQSYESKTEIVLQKRETKLLKVMVNFLVLFRVTVSCM